MRAQAAFSILIPIFLLMASLSKAADAPNPSPLTGQAQIVPQVVSPETKASLRIDLQLPEGYHAYLDAFQVRVVSPTKVQTGTLEIRPIVEFYDRYSKKTRKGISEKAELKTRLHFALDTTEGSQIVEIHLKYQACSEAHCLKPQDLIFQTPFEYTKTLSRKNDLLQALDKGLVFAFFFVFLAGLLTSLTPCIFPMIPITLSILGTQSIGKSRAKGFLTSVFYVFGIAITYASLGVVAAKTGSLFGSALQNPWAVTAMALVFLAMALSMYGLFEIRAPSFLQNRLSNKQTGSGYFGAFFAGILAGVVASPCVGPVLVSVLAYVAQTQDAILGFFLLATFALGFGVLFIILGTFSGLLNKLPKSGPWMEIVKFVFGTTMIGMALYFLKPVVHPAIFSLLLFGSALTISIVFGFLRKNHLTGWRRFSFRAFFLIAAAISTVFLIKTGYDVALKKTTKTVNSNEMLSQWKPYDEELFEEALSMGKPIIIDFFAEWCVACKELMTYSFSDPKVQAILPRFCLLKIDVTSENSENLKLQKRYEVLGLPTILFYSPKGKLKKELTLTGYEPPKELLKRLKKVLE